MPDADTSPAPKGWRAYVARASIYAEPGSPVIETKTFDTQDSARAWAEQECMHRLLGEDVACCVVPLFSRGRNDSRE